MSATPRPPTVRRSRSLTGVYVAPLEPVLLRVPRTRFLEISGHGAPASEEFQECLGALYGIAYTVKFAHKAKGHDFKLGPLEGLYWGIDWQKGSPPRSEDWRWRLLLPVPESVHREDLDRAIVALDAKGRGRRSREVRISDMVEGECVQILHVGPYDQERGTIARMEAFARSQGRQIDRKSVV